MNMMGGFLENKNLKQNWARKNVSNMKTPAHLWADHGSYVRTEDINGTMY